MLRSICEHFGEIWLERFLLCERKETELDVLACSLLSFLQQPRGVRFLRRQRVMVTGQLIPQGDRGG